MSRYATSMRLLSAAASTSRPGLSFTCRMRLRELSLPRRQAVRHSREILGTAKNITIRQCCGKCYASIQTEREPQRSPRGYKAVMRTRAFLVNAERIVVRKRQ
jgi:hypothetical protein